MEVLKKAGQTTWSSLLGQQNMNQALLTGNQPLQGLDACHDRDNLLDIGLNTHGLLEDEQEELSSDQYIAAAQWPSK